VHGRVLDVVESVEELRAIDSRINTATARAFFNEHLGEWKKNGVSKSILEEATEKYIKV
jgi:hypothetical protein